MKLPRLFVYGLLVLAGLSVSFGQEPAGPGNLDRLSAEEEKLELLDERLSDLRHELETLDRRETSLLGELHRLDLSIRLAGDELELLKLQLERGYRAMDENLKRIQVLEKSIDELKPYLQTRARSLYKLGRLSYVRLLLSVEKPSELTRAYRYISRLAREDAEKMRVFLEDQKLLEQAKAELVVQTEGMLQVRKELEGTTRTLESRRASRKALLGEVYARQEMSGTLAHELEEAKEQLGKLVESLAAGASVAVETVDLPMRMFEGEVGWPVEGELGARFGTQLHPRFKTVTVRNGIEIRSPDGNAGLRGVRGAGGLRFLVPGLREAPHPPASGRRAQPLRLSLRFPGRGRRSRRPRSPHRLGRGHGLARGTAPVLRDSSPGQARRPGEVARPRETARRP